MTRRVLSAIGSAFVGGIILLQSGPVHQAQEPVSDKTPFARANLVAWCIVPFDGKKRGPEERAAMLARLGFKRFAYDWRAEHLPTLDRELAALKKHGIQLDAFWFPANLGQEARTILATLKRHEIKTQLWITMGDPAPKAKTQEERIEAAGRILRPIAEEAAKIGCSVGLYNHGGWFGEPENQIAILAHLKLKNVGIVYNLHHGHDHLERFPALLKTMQPHLFALNLNGMVKNGDRVGKKILPLGQGDLDLGLLKTIRASGYRGPIGILGHTQDDAEARLLDNLDGLDWLLPQLDGKAAGPRPKLRTYAEPKTPAQSVGWLADGKAEYRTPPLTVEVRARLHSRDRYNILVASDTKRSGAHWEIFSMAGTGNLTVYLPGMNPDHVHTKINICDGNWHDIAMVFAPDEITLACAGKIVATQAVKSLNRAIVPDGLAFARLVEGTIGCDGQLEYVRLSRGLRRKQPTPKAPVAAEEDTIGLWRFDKSGQIEDLSKLKNPARPAGGAPASSSAMPPEGNQLFPADAKLKAVLIDRSEKEAYLAVRADSAGRLFVGGREALFVFEPNAAGGYERKELYRFHKDAIIIGVEIRGDDLYALTANALYKIPNGRVQRQKLQPQRLLWGLPLDLHVSFHCLAWGPEGDLYLNHGDPLLNYGLSDRPDHWGHWTLFAGPDGKKIPYTGSGAVLRLKPDGSDVKVVAGGLRGPVGLTFDRDGNLFTNDNDHESKADLYAPARLMHVTPGADFGWPRGWLASKTPDRKDLLDLMTSNFGRGVPCDMAFYDEPYLPGLRGSLLMCRWDRLSVTRYLLTQRGASFQTDEHDFAVGKNLHRPAGIAIGRGGRVVVTSLYLAGNVVSPYCVSDLVMITRADDPASHPFDAYDIVMAPAETLWTELSSPALERRARAHQEILRRGGALLDEAARRLDAVKSDDPASRHLPWLAGASGSKRAAAALVRGATNKDADIRLMAIRVLAEYPKLPTNRDVFTQALKDPDARMRLAGLGFFLRSTEMPVLADVVKQARSEDTYLRQPATQLLARRATMENLKELLKSRDAPTRLAGVLAVGIRLTVPDVHDVPAKELPLFYPAGNAFFHVKHPFAGIQGTTDLRDHGRVGSYTTAERWKAMPRTAEQSELFDLLTSALGDGAVGVQLQAAYYLSLLRDPRVETKIVEVRRDARLNPLLAAPAHEIVRAWALGPFQDSVQATKMIEQGAVDLSATYPGGLRWRETNADFAALLTKNPASSYLFFSLQSIRRQHALLEIGSDDKLKIRHNGQSVEPTPRRAAVTSFLLDLQPGSNEILLRVDQGLATKHLLLRYRAPDGVSAAVPERVDASLLAQRLKEGAGTEKLGPEFTAVDWTLEAKKGDAGNGRKLFGTLACVKCHAIVADQQAAGGPSLTDARKRFTVPYLVESILLPGKQVAEPFRATSITTKDGKQALGLVVNETAESLELLLPDATRRTIAGSAIEERAASKLSPMPTGLVKTPTELRDLLAYLLSDRPTPP